MPLSLASFVPPRPHCSDLTSTVSPIVSHVYAGQAEESCLNDISNIASELLEVLWSSRSSHVRRCTHIRAPGPANRSSFEKEIIFLSSEFFTKSIVVPLEFLSVSLSIHFVRRIHPNSIRAGNYPALNWIPSLEIWFQARLAKDRGTSYPCKANQRLITQRPSQTTCLCI
jgi:hypothetical protein